jgi:probable phosphoglycerate mutase
MKDQDKLTRFGLVRHAQTVWNREKKIQGQNDTPLTSDGKSQALRWG